MESRQSNYIKYSFILIGVHYFISYEQDIFIHIEDQTAFKKKQTELCKIMNTSSPPHTHNNQFYKLMAYEAFILLTIFSMHLVYFISFLLTSFLLGLPFIIYFKFCLIENLVTLSCVFSCTRQGKTK